MIPYICRVVLSRAYLEIRQTERFLQIESYKDDRLMRMNLYEMLLLHQVRITGYHLACMYKGLEVMR